MYCWEHFDGKDPPAVKYTIQLFNFIRLFKRKKTENKAHNQSKTANTCIISVRNFLSEEIFK